MFDKKIKFIKNKSIKKDDYTDLDEFKYNQKTDIVPKRNKRLIAVILRENKSAKIKLLSNKIESFNFQKCLYFIVPNGVHECDNGQRIAIYLEGVSLPMSYENIEKEVVKAEYLDLSGKTQTKLITRIKNLKYDGKILDVFTNRKFAEIFTRVAIDKYTFYILIVCIIIIGLLIANMGITYYFTDNIRNVEPVVNAIEGV